MSVAFRPQSTPPVVSPSPEDAEQAKLAAELDRKLAKRAKRDAIAAIAIFVVAVVVTSFPFVMRAITNHQQQTAVEQAKSTVDDWPYPQAKEHLKAAREYNKKLYENGQSEIGEIVDPFQSDAAGDDADDADSADLTDGNDGIDGGDDTGTANSGTDETTGEDLPSARDKTYQSLLNTGHGIMGSIRIPKISVNLPIFHGTGTEALNKGAGHLYGTSLPVGGKNTHSVITGHRGMITAEMFTRLDELNKGDAFYLGVMGETFGYKVDSIKVILPTEGGKYLKINKGEDRVTLMTCTPYGVNTHRLLVSGIRTPLSELESQNDGAIYRDVTITVLVAAALGVVIAIIKRHAWMPMRHASDRRRW